jgi:hypothetical protein
VWLTPKCRIHHLQTITVVDFNVSVKSATIKDSTKVGEPVSGSNSHSQRSFGGYMLHNCSLKKELDSRLKLS